MYPFKNPEKLFHKKHLSVWFFMANYPSEFDLLAINCSFIYSCFWKWVVCLYRAARTDSWVHWLNYLLDYRMYLQMGR